MSPDILEVLKQWSFLSSVLAGFGIAVAIELISLGQKKPIVNAAIAVFLISAVIMTALTFVFVLVMTGVIGSPGSPRPSEVWIVHFVGGVGVGPLAALLLFLAGIGLVGWIHSKLLGIITTISAVLAFVLVIWVLLSMGSAA
jgi:hypothetical protein